MRFLWVGGWGSGDPDPLHCLGCDTTTTTAATALASSPAFWQMQLGAGMGAVVGGSVLCTHPRTPLPLLLLRSLWWR